MTTQESHGSASSDQVLFVCNRLAPSLELAHVIRAMNKLGTAKAVVLTGGLDVQAALTAELVAGAPRYALGRLLKRPFGLNPGRGLSLLAKACRLFRLDVAADFLLTIRAARQGEAALRAIIARHPVACVVTADDRSLGIEFGIAHAANKLGITSVTIPFALSDPGGDWLRRCDEATFNVDAGQAATRWLKRKLALNYAANIREQEGTRLMFLSSGQALALELMRARFAAPWAYGGGATNVAAVYSEAIRDKQVALGVPVEKLPVTGQSSLDELFVRWKNKAQLRRELYGRYGFDKQRPLIILAVPHHAEHGLMQDGNHREMSEALIADLVSTDANVLLSLHPRSQPAQYAEMAQRHGAMIADSALLQVLPCADLFVATHSSTVRWAILMQMTIIVLDDFGVGANGMFDASDVHFVTDRSTVAARASSLLDCAVSETGTEDAATGLFDGLSAKRTIELLESACKRHLSHSILHR